MEIDELMTRFGRLPRARVGRGPLHPTAPDPSIAPRIDEFFRTYPMAARDSGYVEFQERYAGASIEDPDEDQIDDIFGFTDASTDLIDMDGPIVDEDGFLVFAQCIFHVVSDGKLVDMYEYDFAFDTTGDRDKGVYRSYATLRTHGRPFDWHTEDFLTWLDELVASGGRYPRPPVE
jgi:hypothetical protein